jgi:undecaprenyl-diphosphatase
VKDIPIDALADFIARHVFTLLLCFAVLMLVATACLWRLVECYGGTLWNVASRAWDGLRNNSLARRVRAVPAFHGFLTRALSVASYLGIYALLSFSVALAAVVGFFAIADETSLDEDLASFDTALSEALARHVSDDLLRTMAWITHLGDRNFLMAIAVVAVVILVVKGHRTLALAWALAAASGGLLNVALKAIFERTRPIHDHGIITADGWSFPSGHASGAVIVYGLLGYLVIRLMPRTWHLPVTIVTVALIVFVGFSRAVLQVHYFSDVIAGYASAAAWCALSIGGMEAIRRRGNTAVG